MPELTSTLYENPQLRAVLERIAAELAEVTAGEPVVAPLLTVSDLELD